ncbi:MAG TPA: hypothetical protein PKD70_10800 [Saprospiraceae bacterium]|nr:hypothetical protein [Saprospiraceae bacterium]HMP14360.1 hypothetical protein [Saprospiraceae bacterium]
MKRVLIPFVALLLLTACDKEQNSLLAPVPSDIEFRTTCTHPTSTAAINPTVYNTGPGGNVECSELGTGLMSSGRINYNDGVPGGTFPDGITVVVTDGKFVSWSAPANVCVRYVIVKGSNAANVYAYDGSLKSDACLASPLNMGGNIANLSNLTFCYEFCGQECDWIGETAWSNGSQYVTRGNWATYTKYEGQQKTVTLFAGQTLNAGTVKFSAPDADHKVTVTITLNAGWRFKDVNENVKIQDYATAPSGNPSPGLFAHKGKATSSPFSIKVPKNNFYGVHVDVEWEKCD